MQRFLSRSGAGAGGCGGGGGGGAGAAGGSSSVGCGVSRGVDSMECEWGSEAVAASKRRRREVPEVAGYSYGLSDSEVIDLDQD